MSSRKRAAAVMMLALALAAAAGCATVTITQEGERRLATTPTYEQRRDFFLWGLIGEHEVDVMAVCGGTDPVQMQSQMTALDSLLTFITLGIYAPRTARIWCG